MPAIKISAKSLVASLINQQTNKIILNSPAICQVFFALSRFLSLTFFFNNKKTTTCVASAQTSKVCWQSCNCFLNQDLRVSRCTLHCHRHWCLRGAEGSGRCSAVHSVRVCVNSYCKWDLKNWHSHLSSAPHLSQTNEGPEPQSEIDISFWTSQGIFWIWRGVPRSQGSQRALHLSSSPHLHTNNNRERGKKWPGYIFCVHQYSLIHRASWQLKCQQPWVWNPLCCSVEDVWNWVWN